MSFGNLKNNSHEQYMYLQSFQRMLLKLHSALASHGTRGRVEAPEFAVAFLGQGTRGRVEGLEFPEKGF